MRESVGTATLFEMIIGFTLLFAGFLAVAINYNKGFKLKNETLNIIERYEGINDQSIQIINKYLDNGGYGTKGYCDVGEYGVKDLTKKDYELVNNTNQNTKYFYCLNYFCKDKLCKVSSKNNQIFYNVKLFFNFNLPFFGDLLTFKITGDTKGIKLYRDAQKLSD